MIYKTGRIIFSEVDKEQKIVEKQQKTFIFLIYFLHYKIVHIHAKC